MSKSAFNYTSSSSPYDSPEMEQNIYPNLAEFLSNLAQNSTASNTGGAGVQSPLTDAAHNFFHELGAFVQNLTQESSSSSPTAPPKEEKPQAGAAQGDSSHQGEQATQGRGERQGQPEDRGNQNQHWQGFPFGRTHWRQFNDVHRSGSFGPWIFPQSSSNNCENMRQQLFEANMREISTWLAGIVNFLWTAGAGLMMLALLICLPKFLLVLGTIFFTTKCFNIRTGPVMIACAALSLLSELPHFVLVFFVLWGFKKYNLKKGFASMKNLKSSSERGCFNKDKCCYHRNE